MHVRGWGFIDRQQEALDRVYQQKLAALIERDANRASKKRLICGAKTRKDHPCKLKSDPGRRRCKLHGETIYRPAPSQAKLF